MGRSTFGKDHRHLKPCTIQRPSRTLPSCWRPSKACSCVSLLRVLGLVPRDELDLAERQFRAGGRLAFVKRRQPHLHPHRGVVCAKIGERLRRIETESALVVGLLSDEFLCRKDRETT